MSRTADPATSGRVVVPAAGVPTAAALPDDVEALLRRLRLPHIRCHAPAVIATAKAQRWEPVEVLRALLVEESAGRERSALATRRAAAAFPTGKTFAAWQAETSSIPAPTQSALRTLEWVSLRENLVVLGPSGTGKTFLLEALGQQAVEAGLKVAWFTLEDLGVLLRRHRADDTATLAIARVLRADLVMVDLCRHRDYADLGPLNAGQRRRRGWIHRHNPSAPRNARTWTDNSQRPGLGSPASVLRFDGRVNAQLEPGGQTRLWTITRLLVTHHPRPHLLRVPGGNCGDYAEQFGPATPLTSTDRTEVGIVAVSA